MKFLIDENFPRSATEVIAAAGHEAILPEQLFNFGDDDETVFDAAQQGKLNDCIVLIILFLFNHGIH